MEDCGEQTMAYVTTRLYKVKVINGTSNAMGEAEDNVRLHRQSVSPKRMGQEVRE